MKQVLSVEQINAKLTGKMHCYKIEYSHYNNEPYFYFMLLNHDLVVAFGKKVYYHSIKGDNRPRRHEPLLTFDNREYVPLIDKAEAEKLLVICGLKAEKKSMEIKPEIRLKEIAGLTYSNIYKMMREVNIVSSDLIEKDSRFYKGLYLLVVHDKGQFSFPIDNVCEDESNNEEMQNIFFNALNLPVTSKLKTA